MINEERVIMMTRLASYEQGEGKKNVRIGSFFREDYVTVQILKAVICGTIAYAIVFALYIFYNFETFMADIYKTDLYALGKQVLSYYVIFIVAYAVLVAIVFNTKYSKARKKLKKYYNNLKKLNSLYND